MVHLTDALIWDAFRVLDITVGRDEHGRRTRSLHCVHWGIEDLSRRIYRFKGPYIQASAGVIATEVLSGTGWAKSGWPTALIDVDFSYDTVLGALRKIRDANDPTKEIWFDSNSKVVYLGTRGTAGNVVLRIGKNITEIGRKAAGESFCSRIVPLGGGDPPLTIARSQLGVLTVSTVTITVDPYCIPSDGSHVGDYVYFDTGALAGNGYAITASATGTASHSLTTATNLATAGAVAGDLVRICSNATGTGLTHIAHASAEVTGGVVEQIFPADYPSVENLILNGVMYCTAADACDDWTKTNAGLVTVTRNTNTDYIKQGSHSAQIETTAVNEGIYQAITFEVGHQYSLAVWVYVVSGTCRLEVKDGAPTRYWPPENNKLKTTATGWIQLLLEWIVPENAACEIRIVQEGATNSDFYVDSVLVTEGGACPEEFTADRTANRLRREAYAEILTAGTLELSYDLSAAALNWINPHRWPAENFNMGDTVRVIDESQDINESIRIIGRDWDVERCGIQRLKIANVRGRLSSRMADIYGRLEAGRAGRANLQGAVDQEGNVRGNTQRWSTVNEDGTTITRGYLMEEHPRIIVADTFNDGDTVLAANFVVPTGRKLIWFFNPWTTWDSTKTAKKFFVSGAPRIDFNNAELYDKDYANKHQMFRVGLTVGGAIYYVSIPAGTYADAALLSTPIKEKAELDSVMGSTIGYYEGSLIVLEVPA